MSSEPAIQVRQLGKSYQIYSRPGDRLKQFLWRGRRHFHRDFWALRDVSFDVAPGATVGIIGRNGSGKSTLLQMVCGTLTPTTGSVPDQRAAWPPPRARRRVQPRVHRARQRLPLRRRARAERGRAARPLRSHHRLRRHRRLHRHAREDLFVGHVRAARLLGGDQRRPRRAHHRRVTFGRRRALPAALHGEAAAAAGAWRVGALRQPRRRGAQADSASTSSS